MAKEKPPVTPAVRFLREASVAYTDHLYPYEEKGGTASSARALNLDEHTVIKTLIMETDLKEPLIMLMHGDCQVSIRELARSIGARSVQPCLPEVANRHSGYLVGGTSPFGTRRAMPVYLEDTVMALDRIYLNGGKRGYLVGMAPSNLIKTLHPTLVHVAIAKE